MEDIKTLYGYAKPGDWVIATEKSYGYLIGKVETIENSGTAFNGKPFVIVDVTAYDYPHSRIKETEEKAFGSDYALAGLKGYCKAKWPADSIISLSFLDNDIEKIKLFGNSYEASKNFCEIFAGTFNAETDEDKKHKQRRMFDKHKINRMPDQALFVPWDELTCLLEDIIQELLGKGPAGIKLWQEEDNKAFYYAKTSLSKEEIDVVWTFMGKKPNETIATENNAGCELTHEFLSTLMSKVLPFDAYRESVATDEGVWYFGQSATV